MGRAGFHDGPQLPSVTCVDDVTTPVMATLTTVPIRPSRTIWYAPRDAETRSDTLPVGDELSPIVSPVLVRTRRTVRLVATFVEVVTCSTPPRP